MEYINFKHWVKFQWKHHYKEKVHATNTEKKNKLLKIQFVTNCIIHNGLKRIVNLDFSSIQSFKTSTTVCIRDISNWDKSMVNMCKVLSLNLSTPQMFSTNDTKRKLIYNHVNTYQSQWNKNYIRKFKYFKTILPSQIIYQAPNSTSACIWFCFCFNSAFVFLKQCFTK